MKMRIFIFSFLVLIYSVSTAQNFEGYVGAGITASQVSGDSYSGFNRLGANIGVFTFYKLNENRALNLGIQFVQKGSRKYANNANPYSYQLRLNYIEIPVEYKFKLVQKFSIGIGASYGRLMGDPIEKADYAINMEPYNKDEVNALISFYIPLKGKFFLTMKYDNTLFFSPIREHKGGGKNRLNWGQYNSVIVSTLNYKF